MLAPCNVNMYCNEIFTGYMSFNDTYFFFNYMYSTGLK